MRFFHTLRFRLLLGSFLLVLVLFGVYSFFAVRYHSDQMMNSLFRSAERMSDVVKNATHYSMLLNRKEDVYQIMSFVGRQPGVEGLRIFNKRGQITYSTDSTEKGTVVDLHAEACYACHDQEKPLESLPSSNRTRIYQGPQGHRVLGLINPIRNERQCSQAGCHSHPAQRTVLGVLDVRMSLEDVDASLAQERNQMIVVAAVMVVCMSLASIIFLIVTVHKPVQRLMEGTRQLAAGNLDYRIALPARDEIGELARSFNEMTKALRQEKEENVRWAQTLEERVQQKTNELKRIHERMLQIEKMASLGKLSATVAHELNNPLEGILTYAKLLAKQIRKQQVVPEAQRQMVGDLDLIAHEAGRCGAVVKNLLLFSKRQVGELALVSVKQVIERAHQLMRHHFEISNVRFESTFASDNLMLLCDEQQIQQAFVALFVNAVEAMPGGGNLKGTAGYGGRGRDVVIAVSDSGLGIREADIPHVFEPFFSTKEGGTGVGLGLSVVYGIVERHNGTITVESIVPGGSTFILSFPSAGQTAAAEKGDEAKSLAGSTSERDSS